MTLTRWEPFGIELPARWRRWFDADVEPDGWLKVEEIHEDGTLVIRAECPGVDPDKDVEVSLSDGMLHISATREVRTEDDGNGRRRTEFHYGHFSRDVRVPPGLDERAIKANYRDGILEVTVPWPEQKTSTTKVPVTHS